MMGLGIAACMWEADHAGLRIVVYEERRGEVSLVIPSTVEISSLSRFIEARSCVLAESREEWRGGSSGLTTATGVGSSVRGQCDRWKVG